MKKAMKKEYALIKATIDNALEDGNEIILKSQYPEPILNKIIDLDDDDNYIVEEYTVDEDGDFYEGSDFDTAENFRVRFGTWYCIFDDAEDNDWSHGSYSRDEAFAMLKERLEDFPDASIGVVEMGNDPICVDILHMEDRD